MSPNDYWYGDVWLARGYYEAEKLRMERANNEAWQQGHYIYDAVAAVASSILSKTPHKYPSKPYPLKAEKEQEDKEELQAMLYMQNMVLAGKSWGKEHKNGN